MGQVYAGKLTGLQEKLICSSKSVVGMEQVLLDIVVCFDVYVGRLSYNLINKYQLKPTEHTTHLLVVGDPTHDCCVYNAVHFHAERIELQGRVTAVCYD